MEGPGVGGRLLAGYEKFGLEFVEDSAIIGVTGRGFGATLGAAGVTVGRGLGVILGAIGVTSSETSVMRCSFGVSSVADAGTIVRRCRLVGCLWASVFFLGFINSGRFFTKCTLLA